MGRSYDAMVDPDHPGGKNPRPFPETDESENGSLGFFRGDPVHNADANSPIHHDIESFTKCTVLVIAQYGNQCKYKISCVGNVGEPALPTIGQVAVSNFDKPLLAFALFHICTLAFVVGFQEGAARQKVTPFCRRDEGTYLGSLMGQ